MVRKLLVLVVVLAVVAAGAWFSVWLQRSGRGEGPDVSLSEEDLPLQPGQLAEPLAGKVEPLPGRRVFWGAFREHAPYEKQEVLDLQTEVGESPAILMWYQEWEGAPGFPSEPAGWLEDQGIVPMVTWEPWKPPAQFGDLVVEQPEYALRRIAAGSFDAYIIEYALAIKSYGGPVMLRPLHEMDGFWYPWGGLVNGNTPADFVAAWRHIFDLFEQLGATNVTWVWSVNHLSVPDIPSNAISRYWPGGRYVDWIGISGFNWGAAGVGSTWKPFSDVYDDRYRDLRVYSKPVVLTELGAPEVGGDKADWIRDAFLRIPEDYPRIKAVLWYDKRDSGVRDWRIDSSIESLEAFRASIADDRIFSAPQALATAF